MLNKQSRKLLKLISKFKYITAEDIDKKYKIDLDFADYLVKLGFAKYERSQYTPLSITPEGLTYLSQTKYDYFKFLIPTILSILALTTSIIAIIL